MLRRCVFRTAVLMMAMWSHDAVALLAHERDDALELQTAASEVLRVISASPGELDEVFQAMLERATINLPDRR